MTEFNIELVRAQFPALTGTNGEVPPTFFDNPGGTQVPQRVIDAVCDCMANTCANLGGIFRTSVAAQAIVDAAHEAMADFVNARSQREIIFGANMTTLTLHMSRSLGRLFHPGDEIILTRMEHDANFAPWLLMARDHDLTVKYLPFDLDTYTFDLNLLDDLLGPRTRLVCINHASNLTGTINDVKTITAKAHEAGALVYVDSVQYAPHRIIDVQDLDCDFLVCSPYKFFGPHIGVLWGREEVLRQIEPYKVRAASADIPDCFETGALNHEAMAGVTAAIDYFAWIGETLAEPSHWERHADVSVRRRRALCAAMDCLRGYEESLTRQLIDGLSALPGVTVHGITNPNAMGQRVPTVSVTVDGQHPHDMAAALNTQDIYVWDGHNYALEPTGALGLLESGGVLRIGLAHYNTAEEIERTLSALDQYLLSSRG